VRLTGEGAELATRFAGEVYAELEELLAPLPPRDRDRLFRLASAIRSTRASPFASPR
jgi:hypothetical protein